MKRSFKVGRHNSKYSFTTKLKEGDEVVVTTGRSKGESGKIENIDKKHGKVYIAGKNLGKRHQKPGMQSGEGGIVEVPLPLDISNVMLVDPSTKKPTRIGYKIEKDADGKARKVRVAKASGSILA